MRGPLLLIGCGFAALALSTALGATFGLGLVFIGVVGGLAYGLGVGGLAERRWIIIPALILGVGAAFFLAFGVHSVLMQRIGHVEHCTVTQAEEHPFTKYPSVDYVLACPSGEVELSRSWNDRLLIQETDVLVAPPLEPKFADDTRWNLWLVTGVPLAMILLVGVARAVRRVP
ncbi:hypothetical protein LFM09_05085 [Lentzea alba]|uniref:hypothetical protein n=1 Tax=Lentzea alba TaxID=2714351 RepID=UPI0039BF33ED